MYGYIDNHGVEKSFIVFATSLSIPWITLNSLTSLASTHLKSSNSGAIFTLPDLYFTANLKQTVGTPSGRK